MAKKNYNGKKGNGNQNRTPKGRNPSHTWNSRAKNSKKANSDRDEDYQFGKGSVNGGKLSSLNDISWYSKYPELLRAAASIPTPNRPGMSVPVGYTVSDQNTNIFTYTIPGTMVLDWLPTVGYSSTATSPVSIVAKQLYAKVRAAFSGSLSVDAPDLVIYLLCLDSIFSYIGNLKRMYRLLNAYTPNNYTLPVEILQTIYGMEVTDVTALQSNRVALWSAINELIHMTSNLTCPAVFDYFNRHYWMNDNVYADSNSPMAQFYAFNQVAYYQFALHLILRALR